MATYPGTWNETTGEFNYQVSVAPGPLAGDAISAAGTFAAGSKNGFGSSTFDGGARQGTAVIAGKFNGNHTRFNGTIDVGIPNRLGPAPGGSVHATGKLTMSKTAN